MKAGFEEYFPLAPDEVKQTWEKALVVFDTNVLLGLYRITEQARGELLQALTKIKDRVWIPHQVALEFHRRRSIAAFKVEQELGDLCEKTTKLLNTLKSTFNQRNSVVASALGILEKATSEAITTIEGVRTKNRHKPSDDPILQQLAALFDDTKVGKAYSQPELETKYTEAAERFKTDVPPGYLDAKGSKPKPEPRCYNDYVLWSQTLDRIRTTKQSLIFVTNEKDEDWWRLEGADEDESDRSKKKTIGPRPELTREAIEAGAPVYIQVSAELFLLLWTPLSRPKSGDPSLLSRQAVLAPTPYTSAGVR